MPTSLLWLARLLLELPVIANLYDSLAHDLDELFVGLPWTIASFRFYSVPMYVITAPDQHSETLLRSEPAI